MKRLIVDQSWPPHSTGQCGTAQPLALSLRCQSTMSCLFGTSPSISFCFSLAGRFALIQAANLVAERQILLGEAHLHVLVSLKPAAAPLCVLSGSPLELFA